MQRRGRRRAAPGRSVGLLATAALVLLWAGATGTRSAWTSGVVVNSTNSGRLSALSFNHAFPASPSSCQLTGPATSVTCAGAIWSTAAAGATATTKDDTITDNSVAPAGTNMYAQGRVLSCAPVQLANATDATNPLLPRYGTAFQKTDPWGTTSAIALSGGAGYADENQQTNTGSLLGSNFSFGVWFKVAAGYSTGGALMGIDASANNTTSTAGDPHLWLDSTGHVRFRVAATTPMNGSSPGTYADGNWHLAVLTLGSVLVSTTTLYVDGVNLTTSGGLSLLTGNVGYWHLGWGDFTSIGSAPATANLTGSLSGAFVTANTLSDAQVSALYSSASAAAYQATTTGYSGAREVWMLGDSGTTTFTSSISWVTGGDPCAMDTLAWTLGGASVFAATSLTSLATAGWLPTTAVAAPTPGNSQTSTTSLARAGSYDADVAGLHLYAPVSYRVGFASPPATGWSLTFTWSGDPSAAFIA